MLSQGEGETRSGNLCSGFFFAANLLSVKKNYSKTQDYILQDLRGCEVVGFLFFFFFL